MSLLSAKSTHRALSDKMLGNTQSTRLTCQDSLEAGSNEA
jgi:hypothetical protein